jgi:hypothetical protein
MPSVYIHSVSFISLSRRLFEARGLGSYVSPLPDGPVSHHEGFKFPQSIDHVFWVAAAPHGPRQQYCLKKCGVGNAIGCDRGSRS